MSNFDDLVGGGDLSAEEEARLRRVHDLLVQAGPPPDLPPTLKRPPARHDEGEVVQFPLLPQRRWAAALVVAATLVALAFGGGYLVGHSKPTGFHTWRVLPMHGATGVALLKLAPKDSAGNWPMQLEVTNLPSQPARHYYELWATRKGKPVAPCGYFRVHGPVTTVRFSVPYDFKKFDGWVITAREVRERGPGTVVLTT
ncbi:MAG: hypothetical protein ACJ76I_15255 [Gaiellaceae bacterium]